MRLFAIKVPDTVPEDVFDRLLHQLPEHGQERVRKFRHEGDAIRSLTGRLLPTYYLRTSHVLSPSQHPTFGHHPRGKPFLSDPPIPRLDFNTSHEGDYVLLAVVHGDEEQTDVGVDVMDLPADADELADSIGFQALLQKQVFDTQLAPFERLQVAASTGRMKAKLLTTLWTIKEGFTKATGDGISFGLDRIQVDLGDGSVAGVKVDGRDIREDGWTWTVGSIDGGAYGYAVIWRGEKNPGKDVQVERITWDDFVRVFIGSRALDIA